MNKKNLNKGITLVALVITIIVLLILAGVAINMAIDSDGLFSKVNEAVTKWNTAVGEEERIIENLLNTLKGNEVTNPYEDKEWAKAWTCTNKTWSEEIPAGNTIPEDVDIMAKLYATGEKVTPSAALGLPFSEGAEYKLVIEGTGEMGEILIVDESTGEPSTMYAWMTDFLQFMTGASQTATMPYITEVTICDGIKNIPQEAFMYGLSLKQVTIGNNVQDISFQAIGNFSDGNCDVIVPNENIAKLVNGTSFRAIPKLANEENIIKEQITANDVKNNPMLYYGKEVTGYNCANNEAIEKWKIYHSDGENIYLIADNFIEYEYIPAKDGVKMTESTEYENGVYFGTDLLAKYEGAESITDNNVKKWLSYLNSYGTSTNNNMKATAYLLDTAIWNMGFKDAENAKYAIGAPTLDMFEASYNARCGRGIDKKIEEIGYKIKFKDEADSEYDYSKDTLDYMYQFVPAEGHAEYVWLASPSAVSGYYLVSVYNYGDLRTNGYGSTCLGVRPLVCLESDVQLEKVITESGETVYNIAE